ncbi:hypothetical protein UT300007_13030 [Clostridium sp. CTA-7]
MNKKLTLKLLLLTLLSFSLISCGQKDNISKSNNETQSFIKKEEGNRNKDSLPNEEENAANQDTNIPDLFIVAGGPNKIPGICEYSLAKINAGRKIKPPVSNKNSTCYVVETDENIYIDVTFEVYSLMNKTEMAGDMITTKIRIKNIEYPCFSLVESTDGTALEEYALINPLETKRIHYLAEVPTADSATGEFEIILTINGKDFSNKFSLDSLQYSIKENMQQDVKQSLTEEEYYNIIKEAKQHQQDYIDSIDDPHIKQSVQSSHSAAIAESSALHIKYPDDTDTIDAALKRVLNGE